MTRNRKFTPDHTGGGTLEWEELVRRKGFRDRWVKRSIYKAALKAVALPDEAREPEGPLSPMFQGKFQKFLDERKTA